MTEAAVGGDYDALSSLLTAASPQLHARLADKIAPAFRSVLDVEDVLQVTYLEAFQRIARFDARGPGAFLAWITRIAENNLTDAVRALERAKRPPARMRMASNDESSVALYDRLMMTTSTPSRHAATAEITAVVAAALDRLPADYSRVLQSYELQGRSSTEIARDMGRSEGAVYMLRARGLDRLRELLVAETGGSTT